ncbi:MAG: NADP oxidoreductase [Bdellovibrio sp.]|nr:NADP oxidoreductase [Bdellovibrio sp.]
MPPKRVIGTISLAGCFGCHMSILDIDLKFLELIELVEFNRSPLTDIKTFTKHCDIGIIEGGCCNDENVHTLISFRKNCDILVSLGECAIMGGLPALRNKIDLYDCLKEAYLNVPSSVPGNQMIPHHPDLPKILDRIYPCHEIVKIDHFIPGCPPCDEIIWKSLTNLITGKSETIPYPFLKYD